jgi:hypothetical protein
MAVALGVQVRKVGSYFFDSSIVTSAIDRATIPVMQRYGAGVRREAMQSLRRSDAKRVQPNKPPINKTQRLKKSIWFDWDPIARSEVIGPILFPRQKQDVPATALLEYSGTTHVQAIGRQRAHTATYRMFPFMRPANARRLPGLALLWRDTIR